MQPLPIIVRELRVAARQPRTWWRRVLILLAGLAVFIFTWLERGTWLSTSRLGRELFDVLGVLGLLCALLAGPLVSVDCLAKERREGTLGLLFLTDLQSYDIVLGKLFAAAFDMVLGVLVVLPLLAIPMLLGGVGLLDFSYLVVAIFNLLFFSLTVGILASAYFTSVRATLGFTLFFLLVFSVGPPLVVESILNISTNRRITDYLYMFCPFWSFYQTVGGVGTGRTTAYWLNMAGIHSLAWGCLLGACWRIWRSWRQLPGPGLAERWERLVSRFSTGYWARRRQRRERLLAKNPIQWLENRNPLQGKVIWLVFLATTLFWFYRHVRTPARWPNDEVVILWAVFAHWIFCAWLAIQAPHRMAEDKQAGALELLLCTAITPREIVRGAMRVLTRRFGSVLLGMVLFNSYAVYAYLMRQFHRLPSPSSLISNDVFEIACCGALVIPVQAYAFARVGLYQGLARRSSLRATWHLVLKLGILPWFVFMLALVGITIGSRYAGLWGFPNERYIFGLWTVSHLAVCGLCLLNASHQLRRNFRELASQTPSSSLWRRLLR